MAPSDNPIIRKIATVIFRIIGLSDGAILVRHFSDYRIIGWSGFLLSYILGFPVACGHFRASNVVLSQVALCVNVSGGGRAETETESTIQLPLLQPMSI